jgi:diaminohydroxyphosphoribosylaminopyrimidine deaminase/5-amino-6-(5-phosphoribosylamino)uracil reductase
MALAQAGSNAEGGTAYVSLEPCAHYGRTPPCAQALIDASIKKVVVACVDPNEQVAGKGIAMLSRAGIDVSIGLLQESALALNKMFFFRLKHKRPFITLKLAASLDGKTALASGESKWITSSEARADVQRHRAGACAILTGTDTVIADNPQLNVRCDELPTHIAEQFLWRESQPLRIVVDSKNRLSANEFTFFKDGYPSLVYNLYNNNNLHKQLGAVTEQKQMPALTSGSKRFVDLHAVMSDLHCREINHLWVEAGESLSGALFDLGLVDQLILYQAPKILGSTARGLTASTSKTSLDKAITGTISSVNTVGPDTKTVIDFHTIN